MAYIKLEDLKKYPIRINHYDKENGNRDFVLGVESVIEYAENLPTVDVQEVKHGEWIHIGGDEWCCSHCGEVVTTEGSWEKPKKKYCNECGTKMDKGEND